MGQHQWQQAAHALAAITVEAQPDNEPVAITGAAQGFRCIGVGTDAAVFQSGDFPQYAFKLYAEGKEDKLEAEAKVYGLIGQSPYFSTCYGRDERMLVLKFEDGPTLFDCLLQGIYVPEEAIQDVEKAREYIREIGLNPRDIHLKNIILQNGRAKLLDVSEYIKPGNDFRWEHLKKAYQEYYAIIDGKPVPFWLLDTIRKWYHHWNRYSASFEEFMRIVSNQLNYRK
ncbi:serine/threonine protein kinase [Planococcus plakortidis]|uniref:Serine/threonine protein kinase n=1 Tax=Planococcus plakortidis TaxID=1038856 RepID=A0A1C7EBX9_9BACL|nr:serine/threonine protein kinase [Planococcus plakortidis]ANU21484.1 serine/threonine protein kinase [Planococcus plakortidis]